MKKNAVLKIVHMCKNQFDLVDVETNQKYSLLLTFFDINQPIKIGDLITVNSKLLNVNYSGYSTEYTFGDLNSPYGRVINDVKDEDLIEINKNNEVIKLKRLYG